VDPYKRLYKTAVRVSTLTVALMVGGVNYVALQIYGERASAILDDVIAYWLPTTAQTELIRFGIIMGVDIAIAFLLGAFIGKMIIENGLLRRLILRKEYCEGYWAKFPSSRDISVYDPHHQREANTRQPTVVHISPKSADIQIRWMQYDERGRLLCEALARDITVVWPVLQGHVNIPLEREMVPLDFRIEFDWVSPKKAVLRYALRGEPFYIPLERVSRKQGAMLRPTSR
jgi:YD repeat-containing protein